jgi:hypothetical protein
MHLLSEYLPTLQKRVRTTQLAADGTQIAH